VVITPDEVCFQDKRVNHSATSKQMPGFEPGILSWDLHVQIMSLPLAFKLKIIER